tara:strand:+ start:942 stop:1619 length:678 start_codon:yes stop_codon:yes gene_type:complete
MVASLQDISMVTFENILLNELHADGSNGVIVSGNPKLINNKFPVFNVVDDYLFRYLGMEEESISLLSLKDNRTNFDTWTSNETVVETDGNTAYDVNTLLEKKQKYSPQVFKQQNEMNKELNLYMDNEAYKGDVNVILFFRDNREALELANMIHRQNFTGVTYNCWDVLRSDPPIFIDTIPSIGITSNILKHRIPILRHPVNNETLKTFIEANLKEIAIKEAYDRA